VLLVIDVGNTNTVLGLIDGDDIVHTFRISTTVGRTTDEYGLVYLQLLGLHGLGAADVDGAIMSSVVPSVLYSMEKACRRYLDVQPLVVGRKLKTGMKVRMDNPREVGADRIVNAVAAVARWGGPIIVVDFGTATTLDCVNRAGEYVGGAIAPGFKISEEALSRRRPSCRGWRWSDLRGRSGPTPCTPCSPGCSSATSGWWTGWPSGAGASWIPGPGSWRPGDLPACWRASRR